MTLREFSDQTGIDYQLVYRQVCDANLRWNKLKNSQHDPMQIKNAVVNGLMNKIKFHERALLDLNDAYKRADCFMKDGDKKDTANAWSRIGELVGMIVSHYESADGSARMCESWAREVVMQCQIIQDCEKSGEMK